MDVRVELHRYHCASIPWPNERMFCTFNHVLLQKLNQLLHILEVEIVEKLVIRHGVLKIT